MHSPVATHVAFFEKTQLSNRSSGFLCFQIELKGKNDRILKLYEICRKIRIFSENFFCWTQIDDDFFKKQVFILGSFSSMYRYDQSFSGSKNQFLSQRVLLMKLFKKCSHSIKNHLRKKRKKFCLKFCQPLLSESCRWGC